MLERIIAEHRVMLHGRTTRRVSERDQVVPALAPAADQERVAGA